MIFRICFSATLPAHRSRVLIVALVTSLLVTLARAEQDVVFALSGSPIELVTDEGRFRPFAEEVRSEVERLLGVPAAVDEPAVFKLLLSTRVHLAHHFGDDEKAVATAAWIRSLQDDPVNRAFAGLTTLAAVEARRRHPGAAADAVEFRATFRRAFAGQLANLPHTAAITDLLHSQREKILGITKEALLAETRDVIAPAIERRGYCGLAEADQLVRIRHRLVGILPVRTETIQALSEAIAMRTKR